MIYIGASATNEHAKNVLNSYKKWTGRKLIDINEKDDCFDQLFQAPIVVLSHGLEIDPILNFGNQQALKLWEMDWDTFIQTPSRLTAEPMEREERDRFFKIVTEKGFVDNYTGIRISSKGTRFYIINATVWNIVDDEGQYRGQAAAFNEYKFIGH
ncbi:MEKHLA domain-containing protein [Gordoniibacillus kamchatkensis]|uniref:MEKHLA domain-containing protein n=1 Tax=Gordoniibacillus kamchatkensis TaxID=1590651 RepID=A0ABR5AKQ9_9BACL|nr:MEKHLA domain-containing protein [Paenibacillus sp. VKM B-2647]KIL41540.1 MEKHLA domain-containing protein [Paenibacillus sp. VKM B-2647]